jgi:hypothetical protein
MLAVILSFFSPCEYELPKQHFRTTVELLVDQGATVAITQATLPGQQSQPIPAGVYADRTYADADVMFLKENLWNLGVQLVPQADKLVFLDADLRLSRDWLRKCDRLLDKCDICQPFETCYWLDRHGNIFQDRPSAAADMVDGRAPHLHRCHVGFSWAMTRDAYDRLGGIYDLNVRGGGGDAAFAFALSDHPEMESLLDSQQKLGRLNVGCQSFAKYRENALAQRFRIGYPPGVKVKHLWHGDRGDRKYVTREEFFPPMVDGEVPVYRRDDGLLKWSVGAARAMDYWLERREDG